jgi:hypothetical protein
MNKKFTEYVLETVASDLDGWNTENPDKKYPSGLEMVVSRYKAEKAQRYYPSLSEGIADWLQGLSMSFEFANYKILEKGKEFGYKLDNAHNQRIFLNGWFLRIAKVLLTEAHKQGFIFKSFGE